MSNRMHSEPLVMLATFLKWFLLASITGLIVGGTTSLFLLVLQRATGLTWHLPLWMHLVLLPLGGLVTGLLIHYGAPDAAGHGTEAVITAVHEKHGKINIKVAPIKTLATVITLASGGSAGKEGPCAQIGGALASAFADLVRLSPRDRKKLVICGISAGFSSVFGTPLAGTIFGIEVLTIGGLMYDVLLPSFIAGVTSFEVSRTIGIQYPDYPLTDSIPFSETLFLKVILLGILCGLVSWLFIQIFEAMQSVFHHVRQRLRIWKPAMPMIGGLVLAVLILFLPTDYLGLSLPLLSTALHGGQVPFLAFFWKLLFVSITLATGFSGGIVTPLFVVGATAGNVFAHLLHIDPLLGAAIGMLAIVASAANTPVAAIIMGMEVFGSHVGIYALAASVTAYIIVGHRSVYPSQIVSSVKSSWMHLDVNIPLERERNIHVSYHFLRWAGKYIRRQKRRPRVKL